MKVKQIIPFVLVSMMLVACSNTKEQFNENYQVAVVETSSTEESSKITYFDENLNKVYYQNYKYAEFGTNFYRSEYKDDSIFLVPKGKQGKHDTKKVVEVNRITGNSVEYKIDRNNIQNVAVDEDYIFTSSNLNFNSYLTKYNRKNQEIEEIKFIKEYLTLAISDNENVYAFVNSLDSANLYSKIKIYNKDLILTNEIDITEFGLNQSKYCILGKKLYFSNSYDKNNQPTSNIGILDTDTFSLDLIQLEEEFPDDIIYLNDYQILITCTDPVIPEGTYVIVLDINTKKQKKYNLDVPILTVEITGKNLYVLSSNNELIKYNMDEDFKIEKRININLKDSTYLSTLFVKEK